MLLHLRRAARRRVRLILALAVVAAPTLGAATTATPPALADTPSLQTVMDWTPFPADASAPGAVLADSADRVGLALSPAPGGQTTWTRAQLISLDNGRPKSALFTVPSFATAPHAPYWVDEARGLIIYAAAVPAVAGTSTVTTWDLVGISMRSTRHIAFDVPSRFASVPIVAIAPTDDGRDLILVSSADVNNVVTGSGIAFDRVSIAGLLSGTLRSPWQAPYRPPATVCPTVMSTNAAPEILAFGDKVVVGCTEATVQGVSTVTQNRTLPGVAVFSGLDTSSNPTVSTAFFPAPGNFSVIGGSYADRTDKRLIMTDTNAAGIGARVFDAIHERYVGRVPLGNQKVVGLVVDQQTGRFYAGTQDPTVGLALSDLRALVPTQGLVVPHPWSFLFDTPAVPLFGDDDVRHDLLVPLQVGGVNHVLVVHDSVPPYVPPAAADPDAGALNVAEQPGITDSQRSAVAQAYGADYQLIGGLYNFTSEVTLGGRNDQFPAGTDYLRQADVIGATLTGDESTAQSVLASEDQNTEQYRQCVAVSTQVPCIPVPTQVTGCPSAPAPCHFADPTACSDFGSNATKGRQYADTAYVLCNHDGANTQAGSSFVSDGSLFMTTGRTAPVAAPVQVSRSSTDVSMQRASGRGAVATTTTATADGISILGIVRIGSVSTTITLLTHGRPGTSKVNRTVVINDVSVGGHVVCTDNCSSDAVQSAITTAFPGRVHIDFPDVGTGVQKTKSPRGTFVGVVQDPWYHAERVFDAEKDPTDYVVPAMTITVNFDGAERSRLVVDLAGADATDSYRIYSLANQVPFLPPPPHGTVGPPPSLNVPGAVIGPALVSPSPVVAQGGLGAALSKAARFVLGSLGRMLALLPVFLLLGVPVYLSARRRLLLELPLLSRDEGLS